MQKIVGSTLSSSSVLKDNAPFTKVTKRFYNINMALKKKTYQLSFHALYFHQL